MPQVEVYETARPSICIYYRAEKVGKAKVPHHIRLRDGELFAFAGLWEEWETPDGESLRTWSKLPISQGASTLNNAWK